VHLSRHSKSSGLLNFRFSVNVTDRVFEAVRLLVSDTVTRSISASQTVLPWDTSCEVSCFEQLVGYVPMWPIRQFSRPWKTLLLDQTKCFLLRWSTPSIRPVGHFQTSWSTCSNSTIRTVLNPLTDTIPFDKSKNFERYDGHFPIHPVGVLRTLWRTLWFGVKDRFCRQDEKL